MPDHQRSVRYRSRVSIIWAVIGCGLVSIAAVFGWFALSPQSRDAFTIPQVATLALIVIVLDVVILALAFSTVQADAEGVTVRNGLRTKHWPWSEIASVSYREGDPWAHLILVRIGETERTRRPMVGIQRVDGKRADDAVATLRQLHRDAA